jgi:hypothetical protein
MAITKFATAEVLDIKGSKDARTREASLERLSDFHDYRTDDGYMYVRIRAISSRTNKNNDGWPTVELAGGSDAWEKIAGSRTSGEGITVEAKKGEKYGFSTFLGKPVFVDHNNSDPKRARGVIVDSKFHVLDGKTSASDEYWNGPDADKEHLPPSEVELLLEIDAESFPKLAKAIANGDIDGFSMGCDVDYSKCSHCDNKATSPDEYCTHILMKGANHTHVTADGHKTSRKSYENCYGIKFFEISAVFDPADPTALAREVINESPQKHAAVKVAEPQLPQSMETKAPEDVDTLRTERVCPVCGSDMDSEKCDVCGYDAPPESLQNPDLQQAQEADLSNEMPTADPQGDPGEGGVPEGGGQEGSLLTNNPGLTSSVNSSMRNWTPRIYGGTIVDPIIRTASNGDVQVWESRAAATPTGDEPPKETVTGDQDQPITSAFRTARELIEAAKNNRGTNMSDHNKVAAEPADKSGKPDKRVDVTGVGGVDHANNVDASKPTGAHSWENAGAQVDVTGKGGIIEDSNAEASKPSDGTDSVEATSDNAGFDKKKTTDDSGPTKTWSGQEGQKSPVTDKAFPTSAVEAAKQGVQPTDKSGRPDERVNVEEEVDVSWNGGDAPTKTWSGTDGNGVTRQVNPVTRKVGPGNDVKSSMVSIAALRLADTEEELGLITRDEKYERLHELSELSPEELAAEERVVARVKTAGLNKQASSTGTRMPSFRHAKSIEKETKVDPTPVDDAVLDSAIFGR